MRAVAETRWVLVAPDPGPGQYRGLHGHVFPDEAMARAWLAQPYLADSGYSIAQKRVRRTRCCDRLVVAE